MGLIQSKIIQGVKIPLFNKVLDVSSVRHKSTAANISNISTPGYKRRFVNFDNEMEKLILSKNEKLELKKTDPRHLESSKKPKAIQIHTDNSKESFNGVNNVDVDKEMGEIAENQIIYNTASRLLAGKFKGLTSAIKGR
ncbi:MAG: flagellar basal body rod protein FlgB [candidate division Zixibacteria bacterium]|nr:flagellar basal body rod protein FlgB [candidate division Zixibacteria bacterium]